VLKVTAALQAAAQIRATVLVARDCAVLHANPPNSVQKCAGHDQLDLFPAC